jgi:putative FmdB family regulatory protein
MPLYEYQCPGCGGTFEQLRRMQDADLDLACPKCGAHDAKRLLSTFAPQMGSGGSQAQAPCGQPGSSCCNCRYGGN